MKDKKKDEAEQPPTYKQALTELALLARRVAQLAQLEKRDAAIPRCLTIISSVDRLLKETAS